MSPTLTERNPSERPVCPEHIHVEGYEPKPRPITIGEVKTTRYWEQWARERREYEEPYGPIGGRY
jgi:hypothetical protein